MSMEINFDATTVAPSTGEYETIPNGRYLLQAVDGEMKNVPEEGRSGAKIKFQVAEGEHQGATFFQFYNITHSNPTAARIGQGEFSALCHATGVLKPTNLAQFAAIPFYGDVKVEAPSKGKDGKEYGASNKIVKYYRADGSDLKGVVGTIAPTSPSAPTQPKSTAPSWVTGAKKSA